MFSYIWPIALVIGSNIMYQICAKSVPEGMNPFASLTVTYLVAAALSAVMFFVLEGGGSLVKEYGKLNWAPFVLGLFNQPIKVLPDLLLVFRAFPVCFGSEEQVVEDVFFQLLSFVHGGLKYPKSQLNHQ